MEDVTEIEVEAEPVLVPTVYIAPVKKKKSGILKMETSKGTWMIPLSRITKINHNNGYKIFVEYESSEGLKVENILCVDFEELLWQYKKAATAFSRYHEYWVHL